MFCCLARIGAMREAKEAKRMTKKEEARQNSHAMMCASLLALAPHFTVDLQRIRTNKTKCHLQIDNKYIYINKQTHTIQILNGTIYSSLIRLFVQHSR